MLSVLFDLYFDIHLRRSNMYFFVFLSLMFLLIFISMLIFYNWNPTKGPRNSPKFPIFQRPRNPNMINFVWGINISFVISVFSSIFTICKIVAFIKLKNKFNEMKESNEINEEDFNNFVNSLSDEKQKQYIQKYSDLFHDTLLSYDLVSEVRNELGFSLMSEQKDT